MKLKTIIYGLTTVLLASCVGEDIEIIPNPAITANSVRFERRLTSIAIDENFKFDLNINGQKIDSNDERFSTNFSSNDETIATVDDSGTVTPLEGSQGKEVIITASLIPTDLELNEITESITEKDTLIIGLVTISENEANLFTDTNNNGSTVDEITSIIENGYIPKITINENFTEIDVNQEEEINLTATFQNRKNEVEEIEFSWSSSDENILTIDANGKLSPISKGTASISAIAEFEGETISSEEKTIIVSEETVIIEPEPITEPEDTVQIVGSGNLQSNSSYTVDGSFEIFTENGKNFISLSEDFSAQGLPDLVLYLSNSTTSNAGAPIVASPETTTDRPVALSGSGAQTFEIPATINPDEFQNVLLFCRRFRVRVGFGVINR